jgi:hypothetical protein
MGLDLDEAQLYMQLVLRGTPTLIKRVDKGEVSRSALRLALQAAPEVQNAVAEAKKPTAARVKKEIKKAIPQEALIETPSEDDLRELRKALKVLRKQMVSRSPDKRVVVLFRSFHAQLTQYLTATEVA